MENNRFEQQYYEQIAEQTAQNIEQASRAEPDVGKVADRLIQEVLTQEELSRKQKIRFRADVMERVRALQARARDKRENRLLNEFESQLVRVDKKHGLAAPTDTTARLMPAGLDQNFSFVVRGYELDTEGQNLKERVGERLRHSVNRVWGTRVNAAELGKLVDEIAMLEETVSKRDERIRILKAARDATRSVAGLAKDLFLAKKDSRGGWLKTAFSAEANLLNSVSEAWAESAAHKRTYEKEAAAEDKKLRAARVELSRKKAILDAAMEKIEQARTRQQAVFDRTFGRQLEILETNKDQLKEADYQKHLGELRSKVRAFGTRTKVSYMEYYLNKALGISSAEAATQEQAGTRLEKTKELAIVSRWLKETFMAQMSDTQIEQFVRLTKEKFPMLLPAIRGGKVPEKALIMAKFAFDGQIDRQMVSDRMAGLTPGRLLDFMKMAEESTVTAEQLKKNLQIFAKKWPSDVKTEELPYYFEELMTNPNQPDMLDSKARADIGTFWRQIMDAPMPQDMPEQIIALSQRPRSNISLSTIASNLNHLDEEDRNALKFFFTGKHQGKIYIQDSKLAPRTAEGFIQAFGRFTVIRNQLNVPVKKMIPFVMFLHRAYPKKQLSNITRGELEQTYTAYLQREKDRIAQKKAAAAAAKTAPGPSVTINLAGSGAAGLAPTTGTPSTITPPAPGAADEAPSSSTTPISSTQKAA